MTLPPARSSGATPTRASGATTWSPKTDVPPVQDIEEVIAGEVEAPENNRKTAVPEVISLDPFKVEDGERLRALEYAYVELLAASIGEQGQIAPIQVRATPTGYLLVSGAHRLAACRELNRAVEAVVIDCDDLTARLLEIDENLIRRDLNPLDRAVFLAERKAVYEEMHPETKNGGKRPGAGRKGREKSDLHDADLISGDGTGNQNEIVSFSFDNERGAVSFSKDTAKKTGFSQNTIERAVRIARKIPASVRERIVGTPLAENQKELLALAGIDDPAKQADAVRYIQFRGARSVAQAVAMIEGRYEPPPSHEDRVYTSLETAWSRAGEKARLGWLGVVLETGDLERHLKKLGIVLADHDESVEV